MYEVSVTTSFRARHAIALANGSLEEPHEHDWQVTATFRSETLTEPMGVVIDFQKVATILNSISSRLEGTDLNRLPLLSGGRCSAERLAELLAGELKARLDGEDKLYRVTVTEAAGCTAAYYPGL